MNNRDKWKILVSSFKVDVLNKVCTDQIECNNVIEASKEFNKILVER